MTTRRVMSLPALETCASVVSAYECVTEGNKKKIFKKRRGFISHCSAVLFFSTQRYGMLAVRFIQEIPHVSFILLHNVCVQ